MIRNYFKIAFRNLSRHKGHSFINIAGLSVGMAVAMLIGLWIYDELSFDKYHQHYNRIAQVMQTRNFSGNVRTDQAIPLPLETELRKSYGSDFKHIVLSSWTWGHILAIGDKKIMQPGSFMQAGAPDMLSLHMQKGTRNGLNDPSGILLAASVAKSLFGDADPVNQVIRLDNTLNAKVTGVFEDLPANTTFKKVAFIASWDLYASNNDWVKNAGDQWENNSFQLFVQLADQADIASVSAKIKDSKLKHLDKEGTKTKPALFLQPMSRWHLYQEFKNGVNTGGRIEYVWLFGIIGVFVLLLACINFMNLSTARSEKRAKEVGIRKAIGSMKWQLIGQFFSESLLVVGFSFVTAILLVSLMLPFFNDVAAKNIQLPLSLPAFWLMGLAVALVTVLLAGSYPAFYLSSFQPVKVLKGTFRVGRLGSIPRKVLVVVQFSVSVVLIVGTLVVFRQVQHARNRPTGYDRAGLISVAVLTAETHTHFNAMKQELLQSGAVLDMSESTSPLTTVNNNSSGLEWKGKDPTVMDDFAVIGVDPGFSHTVGWQFVAGRNFNAQSLADSFTLILNESAVKYMGLKNPVGEIIHWGRDYTIIGVVKDMIMQSPYEPVKQTVFAFLDGMSEVVNIRINPAKSTREALAAIEPVFKKYAPGAPVDYKFIDEEYGHKFADEERIGKLAGFFAVLAIFISCLGLFGMASFMAEQRTKEIGVRKVLGASVFNLWRLLSKEFVVLVSISLAIAIPLSWYLMYNWLQSYQYRTSVAWWIFVAAGVGAMVITLLTVSFQAIKAALANPVRSLRSE
ncbi:ABC transporter permease [Paraflavitalea soli]|uniref:ABC transporter permease n=1 Tax=Paraflavitalea soli TaxID=2315862 RepID=A0A3B7MJX8_9BACT|nr:ABC transporter permease [Paraflavitalea soli]AXY74488.1 ABC transporter permease [Paraflavitalea soli]